MTNWNLTADALPPEGEVVETASSNGLHSELKRSGNLWFSPDGSMYVYYTPVAWRSINTTNQATKEK